MTFTETIEVEWGETGVASFLYYRVANGANPATTPHLARTQVGIQESPAGSGTYAADITWDTSWSNARVIWDDGTDYAVEGGIRANVVKANGLELQAALTAAGTPTVVLVQGQQVGVMSLIRGDSYLNADGNALTRNKAPGAPWPADLTGWSFTFTARKAADNLVAGAALIVAVGAIVTAVGDAQAVRFDLPAADTALLAVCTHGYEYDIQATKAASRVTLETGTLTVKADQTLT